jgi:ubiquinone/menaquinone biosynthesis C-methylase UbiE
MNNWLIEQLLSLWIGSDRWAWFRQLDWEQAITTWQQPDVTCPDYHESQAFHGIAGGYQTEIAAITYDPVTQLASPPHEGWLRHQLLSQVQGQPQSILDLACGTGSTTLLLKQQFPNATVTGLDLSPYMLVMADHKAQQAKLVIDWQHGLAEQSPWASEHFDLVTISFLFHEMPAAATQRVLKESWRLLKPGGQILILDGSQHALRHLGWVIDLFREPYSKAYAAGCLTDWLTTAGFEALQSRYVGFIHAITIGHRST